MQVYPDGCLSNLRSCDCLNIDNKGDGKIMKRERKRGKISEVIVVSKKRPFCSRSLGSRGFTPCRVSLDTKAGKFDIVFDNNVRKLEEIQPVVQGIKAQLSGPEFQQLLACSSGCVVW